LSESNIDAKDEADWCHVFRYAGEQKWIDCGRVGSRKTTGVMGLSLRPLCLRGSHETVLWGRGVTEKTNSNDQGIIHRGDDPVSQP